MAVQTRSRRQASLTINAPSTKYIQTLGRGMIYREIVLRLSGSVTFGAGANNTATGLGRGDVWSALSDIRIVVNGTDVIRQFTGWQLWLVNKLMLGTSPRTSAYLGDATTAAPNLDSTLIIPLWMPLSVKPMDTALDSSKLSDLRIEVTSGAFADFNSGTAPTAYNLTLDVGSVECFGIDGEFSDCRIYPIQNTLAAANANLQIPLPVGPLYRGFIVNFAASAASTAADIAPFGPQTANATALTATGITNVQLVSGTTIFRDMPTRMLQDWQRQRMNFDRQFVQHAAAAIGIAGNGGAAAISAFLQPQKSLNFSEDASFFMDLCQDGYLTEGLDTIGFSEAYLNLNVAAAGTVTVLPIQIFPRRRAA